MDFSYHRRTFRTVRILVSSTFLSRVSKVAIKVVCLRMEHRARLLKRTNAKDDQAAATADDEDDADTADTDDDDDDAKPKTTTTPPSTTTTPPPPTTTTTQMPTTTPPLPTTTQMPYQHLQQYICCLFNLSPFWLSYIIFDAVFVCRRRIPTTVRKVHGTKSLVPRPGDPSYW